MESKTLAKIVGEDEGAVEALVHELKEHGVYSQMADGTIYNRRMERKREISFLRSEAGKMGGRPKSKTKPMSKHTLNMNMNMNMNSSEYNKILTLWNEFAEAHKLVKIVAIMKGSSREAAVRSRMAEKGFDFEGLLKTIGNSPFLLCMVPDKPFRATFDWTMKASNYQKIVEGNYLSREDPVGLFHQRSADHLGALKERA